VRVCVWDSYHSNYVNSSKREIFKPSVTTQKDPN